MDDIFEPPYHPMLNPIENIWGIVKSLKKKRNVCFKINDVIKIAEEEFGKISMEEEEYFGKYVGVDRMVDELVINLQVVSIVMTLMMQIPNNH